MSATGQTEKNSVRAYVFRFAHKLGHRSTHSTCLKRAKALNRCAIARGGGRGAHQYGSTRGEMVSSVWVILSRRSGSREPDLRQELPMITEAISPLRQRMIEDMSSRKLGTHTQRSHIYSCKRFAAFLKRSPDTATAEDIRLFQLHLAETGMSICNRNRIMTGVRFLFRVTLRRLDLAAEIYHLREPQKIAQVMSPDETRRLLAVATSLKARVALSLCYGGGLRASEVVRLKVKHIDKAQRIIRIEQSKGRKDRNVMLSPKMLDLLRQW